MKLPAITYGIYKDVKRECDKAVKKIQKGIAINEAVGVKMLDTNTSPGCIIMEGPSPLTGGQQHFHLFCFLDRFLTNERDETKRERFFYEALQTPWSTLLLLTGNCGFGQYLHIPSERHKPFLQKIIEYYDYFDAAGNIYTADNKKLWNVTTNIKFVLARNGVPKEDLFSPLPPGGIKELIDKYHLLD